MVGRLVTGVGAEGNLLGRIRIFLHLVRRVVGDPIAVGQHAIGFDLSRR